MRSWRSKSIREDSVYNTSLYSRFALALAGTAAGACIEVHVGINATLVEIASYLLNPRQAARNVRVRDRCGTGTQILFSVAEISQPNQSQPVKKGALNSERGVQMKKLLLGTVALAALGMGVRLRRTWGCGRWRAPQHTPIGPAAMSA